MSNKEEPELKVAYNMIIGNKWEILVFRNESTMIEKRNSCIVARVPFLE